MQEGKAETTAIIKVSVMRESWGKEENGGKAIQNTSKGERRLALPKEFKVYLNNLNSNRLLQVKHLIN